MSLFGDDFPCCGVCGGHDPHTHVTPPAGVSVAGPLPPSTATAPAGRAVPIAVDEVLEDAVHNAPAAHPPVPARGHLTNTHGQGILGANAAESVFWADRNAKRTTRGKGWMRLTLNGRFAHILTCPDRCFLCGMYRDAPDGTRYARCGSCDHDLDMPVIGHDGGMDELKCPVCGTVNWERVD